MSGKPVNKAVRVLISYAHEPDDAGHRGAVRKLWLLLRECGIDAQIDLTAAEQPQDWTLWMLEQVREADFVLVVASPAYRRGAEGTEERGKSLDVQWEAALIRDEFLADRMAARRRFLPVLIPGRSADDIPVFFGPAAGTHYKVTEFNESGIERLLRMLTGQPLEVETRLGKVPYLAPQGRRPPLDAGVPPDRNPLFSEREAELGLLRRRLTGERRVVLSGMGGVGKSQLAIEYLHRAHDEYPDGVFWLRGESAATLAGDFAALAWLPPVELAERVEREQERVRRWSAGCGRTSAGCSSSTTWTWRRSRP